MPGRMWRHSVHSLLQLSRHRLSTNFELMLTFIYLAYSMIAFLYGTNPISKTRGSSAWGTQVGIGKWLPSTILCLLTVM
ncbi:hypothetical protein CMUS01_13256 [Colletotrichum musicola]|uniref:Uncharacterized protein n=1 Tax=Colletotrichum musicola TaxID=2175873 RepID=A0A8H6JE59_9PEZI|nr:hypothetical protein CMUS01_13256 [Colletotrichum musicola]